MEQSAIAQGKDVREAILSGLKELNAQENEVDIEIIQHGKKGFLGVASKPAVVKITKKQPSPAKNETNLEGKVWIENGKIFVNDSSHSPQITPGPGLRIFKNGELITERTTITAKDELSVDLQEEVQESVWNIHLNPSSTKALLELEIGYRHILKLEDQLPESHLVLTVAKTKIPFNGLDSNEILQKLNDLGVNYGINHAAIHAACQAEESGTFEIATGTEPTDGKNGWLELLVDYNDGPVLKEREDGSIDLREKQTIPSVYKDQPFALIHPPTQGQPGMTVKGETIPPKPSLPLQVVLGQGAEFTDQFTKVKAVHSGRPQVESNGVLAKISVVPKLVHSQDVDLASGNLRFSGDIEISGDVNESMKVEAEGMIMIHGTVSMASVVGGNAVIIKKNLISGEVVAGETKPYLIQLLKTLQEVTLTMDQLHSALDQLLHSQIMKDKPPKIIELLHILLDKKYTYLKPLIKELTEGVFKNHKSLDNEWTELADELSQIFLLNRLDRIGNPASLQELVRKSRTLNDKEKISTESKATVSVSYALNSKIFCNGDVHIGSQGCYHTSISAEGKVKIGGKVRGGEIYGGMGVDIKECGSKGGSPTLIKVPEGQQIRIQHIVSDTILQIGNRKHTFYEEAHNVNARVDREGVLHLH